MHGVSIIIPCFGARHLLGEAVASVLAQPLLSAFEIIVVDDASPDPDTQAQLTTLEADDRVKIIRCSDTRGAQRARNLGLEESRFDYVLMMDADDRLNVDEAVLRDGTYMDRGVEVLSSNLDVAFVHCATWMFGEASGPADTCYPLEEWMLAHKHHAPTWIMYRRADAIACGKYDEAIEKWQDWSFATGLLSYRRRMQMVNDIHFFSQPYYLYRIHDSGLRISRRDVDEKAMVERTVSRHPDIFDHYYPGLNGCQRVQQVLANKPRFFGKLSRVLVGNPSSAFPWAKQRVAERLTGHYRMGTQ